MVRVMHITHSLIATVIEGKRAVFSHYIHSRETTVLYLDCRCSVWER